jgi:hypothetical protein
MTQRFPKRWSLPRAERPQPAAAAPSVLVELESIHRALEEGEEVLIWPGSDKAQSIAAAIDAATQQPDRRT